MRYMQQQLGFGDAHTVASGDANNDLLMLQQVSHVCRKSFQVFRQTGQVTQVHKLYSDWPRGRRHGAAHVHSTTLASMPQLHVSVTPPLETSR